MAKEQARMTEESLGEWLVDLLTGERDAQRSTSNSVDYGVYSLRTVRTFAEAGHTLDKGLVVIMADGSEFEVVISKRR